MQSERLTRIGDKIISLDKAVRFWKEGLHLRAQGYSQQEVARRLSLDRSFVSRLEAAGEIRKGERVAAIGFPVANKEEILDICHEMGLDFSLILTDAERWALAGDKKALEFFNQMMDLLARLRSFDTLVLITSEKWYRLAEALLDMQIIFISLGPTPVNENCRVDPGLFRGTLEQILDAHKKGAKRS